MPKAIVGRMARVNGTMPRLAWPMCGSRSSIFPAGAQPMADASGRVVLSFNGEIYNYRELRVRLERRGIAFRGDSDTEVLANLLACYGTECLPWLNGIFAFAAWVPAEQKLLLRAMPLA